MKHIKILFTREKKAPFKKASKEVNTEIALLIAQKFLDLKKGFCHKVYTKDGVEFLVKIKDGDISPDALQVLAANAGRSAKSLVQKKEKGKVECVFDASVKASEIFFLEKGLLLIDDKEDRFKSENNAGEIEFTGLKDKKLKTIIDAVKVSRALTVQPSNILTPEALEKFALELGKKDKALKVKILSEAEIKKEKMNMLLAVNSGSPSPARVIVIEYTPKNAGKTAPLALIGKGLVYDSGGLYAKPYPHMNSMHIDMAGSASVLAIMSALSELKVSHKVVGVCGVVENLIDGKSYRNGDILTSRKGLTVEIKHTDAEGRLVLADILDYATEKFKPSKIFDFATLTGAVHAALGELYTGVFSDSDSLIKEFKVLGDQVNDKVWQLPLDDDIKEGVKSKCADIANSSNISPCLGASTAAAFLSNFVKDTKKWVHFDIAGTTDRSVMKKPYDLPGLCGTGAIVHLMLAYLSK